MKILQLLCFPLYGSGSGIFVRKLSETLVAMGHKVAIVCPDERKLNKIKIYNVKLPFMAAFTGHPEYPEAKLYSQLSAEELNDIQSVFSSAIVRAVENFKPDIIHVQHAANLSWIANYIKSVYGIHYIITSHNTDIINAIVDKRYIPLTQDAANRADFITAVSNDTKKRFLRVFGHGYPRFALKNRVTPTGVDTKLYSPTGSVDLINRKLKLSKKDKIILYSGKITKIKGLEYLIRSFLKLNLEDIKLIIVGEGPEILNLRKLSSTSRNKIIFTGYLGKDDKRLLFQLYRRADVFVLPSTLSEGLPLSVLESMASGTPVIASNIGGIPTAIKDGVNGFLIKPKDEKILADKIQEVLTNDDLKRKLSLQAREDTVRKFDWYIIAQNIYSYYQRTYENSLKRRSTKLASYISRQEYEDSKRFLKK